MKSTRLRARCTLLVALAIAAVAQAQPALPTPGIDVGDTWEFRETRSDGKTGLATHVVTALLPGGGVRMQQSDQTLQDYDSALNWLPRGRRDHALLVNRHPLKVGDEWKVSRRFPNPTSSEDGTARVVAYEPITVPAGEFQCYRIEVRSELATRKHTEQRFLARWYCPAVKWFAKEVIEVRAAGKKGDAAPLTLTTELVRFRPAR